MKRKHSNRLLTGAALVFVAAIQSSCSTSNSEAWNKIQNEGLIPYLVDGHDSTLPGESQINSDIVAPRRETVVAERKPQSPVMHRSGVVIAPAVKGKPGYVYSPHTTEMLMVDVRDFQPGKQVRCPYTKKSFVVPGESDVIQMQPRIQPTMQIAARPRRKPLPKPNREISVPKRQSPPREIAATPKKIEEPKMIEPVEEKPAEPRTELVARKRNGNPPPDLDMLALPKRDETPVPVGKRVPGKPNYVYSPFAASNQVVDVEGHSAGTKVKCPYTGKVFAVPAASE